jgi:hypothetical protein
MSDALDNHRPCPQESRDGGAASRGWLVLRRTHPGRVGGEPAGLGVVRPTDGECGIDRIGLPAQRRRRDRRPGPVEHHAEAAEVDLALHAWIVVGDTRGGPTPPEPAPLRGEVVQRPIRHHHSAAGELAVDIGQLQLVVRDPVAYLRLMRQQRHPRRAVPLRLGSRLWLRPRPGLVGTTGTQSVEPPQCRSRQSAW